MKKPKFPEVIYVSRDQNCSDENEDCLLAWTNYEAAEEGDRVATYRLVEVGVHVAEHHLDKVKEAQ